jgi:hypothetical protein
VILKGSSRAYGANLATHLMRTDENEHVDVHELRGFVGETLHEAFAEAEAVSKATKCEKYLFSLSLNPPEEASPSIDYFISTADRIEEKLGLVGQPRAIVFHEKEARRHAHVVWSRIDTETMTAREMDFFKLKLRDVSRELFLENGWEMPCGLMDRAGRDPTNFTRGEWEQAKRLGQDPRWAKTIVQDCWKRADNAQALKGALEERGMYLARGDRRGHVVVDSFGSVHSLPRALGLKTKAVRERLGDSATLESVDEAQRRIGERLTPAVKKHIEAARTQFEERARPLRQQKLDMGAKHRETRAALARDQQAEQLQALQDAKARLPRGLRGLWDRITGRYQELRRENESAAQAMRKKHDEQAHAQIQLQLEERRSLQVQIAAVRAKQAQRMLELRKDLSQFMRFSRPSKDGPAHALDRTATRERGHER